MPLSLGGRHAQKSIIRLESGVYNLKRHRRKVSDDKEPPTGLYQFPSANRHPVGLRGTDILEAPATVTSNRLSRLDEASRRQFRPSHRRGKDGLRSQGKLPIIITEFGVDQQGHRWRKNCPSLSAAWWASPFRTSRQVNTKSDRNVG
jgi:hypothetical protein